MSSPAQRIDTLIKSLNLNPRSFAIQCGYSQATTFYSIIKRDAKPTSSTIDKICNRFPQVNREWLMTGYGSMFIEQENEDLTVTAHQVIENLKPLIPKPEMVDLVFKEFGVVKQQMSEIHKKLNSIEFIEALKMIKSLNKDKNTIN